MKKHFLILLLTSATTAFGAAQADAERQALTVLQSDAPVAAKEVACLRLKEIGTASSVPHLANSLTNDTLAQWALDALETLPAPEAGEALLAVLPGVSGNTKAGVIHALGLRRVVRAVSELATLSTDSDELLAISAAQALGRIANRDALAALQNAHSAVSGRMRMYFTDALLACADRLRTEGNVEAATKVYEELRAPEESPAVRLAAFRGSVLCAGEAQTSRVLAALIGQDELEQSMALQLVRELPALDTLVLAGALDKIVPAAQVALIEALRQRGDPVAAVALAGATRKGAPAARLAAIKALGELGDASHAGMLAELAGSAPGEERSMARVALVNLHRGDIFAAILAEISRARPDAKLELVQALARRGDPRAVPELLRLAVAADDQLGVAATRALENLAGEAQLSPLLALMLQTANESRRAAAVGAFVTVATRCPSPHSFSSAALKSWNDAAPASRSALLEAAGQIGGPGVLEALRAALKDADAHIRETALRTMSEYAGDAARPDLLKLAEEATSDAERVIALRGYWRLVEAMSNHSSADRLAAVRAGLVATKTPTDQKLGLARLAELRGVAVLELAQTYRRDPAVRLEAEAACLQVASTLSAAHHEASVVALRNLAGEAGSRRVRDEAQVLLTVLQGQAGYISSWLVSGPYRQEGREAQQLFDVKFAPESAPAQAEWRPLPESSSLTNHWLADLGPVVGGDHCVVYLKTRVFCPGEQPIALELGSDDGVKLWINGALVHANNAVRGFTVGEDKVKGTLKEGWNDFLVKITQHTLGCAVAIRVLDLDGKPLPGLRMEATD
jgi:HEAT repeat protein